MALPVQRKLYLTLLAGSVAGYTWLFFNELVTVASHNRYGGCIMKSMTHVPCPSCGTTRSVESLLQGDLEGALYWNPMGLLVLVIMVVAPVWILIDTLNRKYTLYSFYLLVEETMKKKKFALFFGLLIVGNWIWNIYKGL